MVLLLKKPTLVSPNVVWVLDFFNDPQIQFFEIPNLSKNHQYWFFEKYQNRRMANSCYFKNLRTNGKFHEITSKEPQFSGAVLWLFCTLF
jgi:hypothetical protein